jgi:ethanolamine utilization microcompartment shell protein EutS
MFNWLSREDRSAVNGAIALLHSLNIRMNIMSQQITDLHAQAAASVEMIGKLCAKIDELAAKIGNGELSPEDASTVTGDTSALANAIALGNSKLA